MISIHAPTRGATQPPNIANTTIRFQSTLPREERQKSANRSKQFKHFNPRSHERSDAFQFRASSALLYFNPRSHERSDVKEGEILLVIDISIHAPTRGATSSLKPLETYHCSFQSTLPREERQRGRRADVQRTEFQSTLPREERHTSRKNSDTHTRISIHAPTRGATILDCTLSVN